jgi:hypothetical protein
MRPRKAKPRRLIGRPTESEHPEAESKPLFKSNHVCKKIPKKNNQSLFSNYSKPVIPIHKKEFITAKFE